MIFSAVTDIGLIREKNQDSYLAINNKYGDFLGLVADGIGGGKAGEVASSEAIRYFNNSFSESGPFSDINSAINYLEHHISACNKRVYDLSKSDEMYSGMGTTITGILITSFGVISINIGDSRVYGLLDNEIYSLTKDDTLINQMIDSGEISLQEAINHPKRHYLVKALGILPKVEADIHKVKNMEYYLVCSDGLHGLCSSNEMAEIINQEFKTIDEKVEELKNLALLKGGFDNISAILVKI